MPNGLWDMYVVYKTNKLTKTITEVVIMEQNNHMVNKDGSVDTGKVENVINRMGEDKQEEILSNFEHFKSYLSEKVELGEKMGMDEEKLAKTAEKVAGYLADYVEPKNREEKLLQEIWKVGNQEERHCLSHMLVRMVSSNGTSTQQ